MTYRIVMLRRAQKELAALPQPSYERVKQAIAELAANPRPSRSTKLVSRDGWRLRAGVFRVIYEIDDNGNEVTVLHVGHRRDVYR